jgi:hypothetical protein
VTRRKHVTRHDSGSPGRAVVGVAGNPSSKQKKPKAKKHEGEVTNMAIHMQPGAAAALPQLRPSDLTSQAVNGPKFPREARRKFS